MSSQIFESSTCNVCNKICLDNCIFCDLCNRWLHAKCVKLSLRQLRSLSTDPNPFFCPKCVSHALPFGNVTNAHIDNFNSLITDNHILNNCSECSKEIKHKDQLKCQLGKYFLHKKCSKSDVKSLNHALWSCVNCKLFPFNELDEKDLIENLNTADPVKFERRRNIKVINKIKELKSILPTLKIPDPTGSEDHIDQSINFDYYEINKFIKLTSTIH